MNEIPKKKFWMVYGIGQDHPTVRHARKETALAEAKRLAKRVPDTPFVVLEAVAAIVKREFDLIILREDVETYAGGLRAPSCHQADDDDILSERSADT